MKLIQVCVVASMLAMLASGLSFSDVTDDTNVDVTADEERIYGGSDANIAKYPYMASLKSQGSSLETYCGGALIAPQYVLTAGNCLEYDLNLMIISFGMRNSTDIDFAEAEHVRPLELYRHPKFNMSDVTYDVALIKLRIPLTRKFASLPAVDGSSNPPGTMATVMGWGYVNEDTVAKSLKTVDVEIISAEECSTLTGLDAASESMMCVGKGDGKGACERDGGGPLVVGGAVVGIASAWLSEECATAPGWYTRVSSVLDFINDILDGGATGNVTDFLTMPYDYSSDPRPMPTETL